MSLKVISVIGMENEKKAENSKMDLKNSKMVKSFIGMENEKKTIYLLKFLSLDENLKE